MGKEVVWTEHARSEVRGIEQSTALRISHALARLTALGEGDVKRLQNTHPAEFRLRVGDYRVRFYEEEQTVTILSVRHRPRSISLKKAAHQIPMRRSYLTQLST